MKRNIKTVALVLSCALAFSGMYGCGSAPESEPVDTQAAAEDQEDGKGDLITDEDQSADSDTETVVNELALRGPSYTGLSELYSLNNEDGTYIYQDMTEDTLTVITNMCSRDSRRDGQDPDAYAENYVCAVVDDTASARIISSKEDEAVSASTKYPSYRVYWESGANEDTKQNVGVVVLADNFTFYYGYGCPIDYYEENADFYESELGSVELIDLANLGSKDSADAGESSGEDAGGYDVYLDKINELKSEGLADQFTLAYINDDDSSIPELIASDSKGSFDHENAFIFTVSNGEVVEVASVIAGVDGANLDYAIGANIIHISGAAAGMRDVFSRIENGKLKEVFVAEASSMDEDAKFSINGNSVKESEYYEQINAFMEPYNPLLRIAYDGLYEVEYKYEDGYGGFEQGASERYTIL
ncbi:MAG: hypothetical protein K6E49_07875 [Lachnospiraceae bacterium]|nr:hypothetical protein [Lachnospiraceae bacterium]